jgi:hypothetical protein
LRELEIQDAAAIDDIDDVEPLVNLRFLGASDCGDIASLAPVAQLQRLETIHAWGSTRILDDDLFPLTRLPRLKEVRMRDRRSYRPTVAQVVSAL